MNICYMFPGQGTQQVGMIKLLGDNLKKVEHIFEMASDITQINVQKLCLESSKEDLAKTVNTQIAVTAMNMAYYSLLEQKRIFPDIVLGHSLGQYSALVAVNSISMEDIFRIVKIRAELMENVKREGVLYSILGLSFFEVSEICGEIDPDKEKLSVALYNTQLQIVVGGETKYVELAVEMAKRKGAKAAIKLNVSNAFHTPLMAEMQQEFRKQLDSIEIKNPERKIILNCKADFANSSKIIKEELVNQCCNTVMWKDSVEKLKRFSEVCVIEVGVGKVLCGTLKKIVPELECHAVSEERTFKELSKLHEV